MQLMLRKIGRCYIQTDGSCEQVHECLLVTPPAIIGAYVYNPMVASVCYSESGSDSDLMVARYYMTQDGHWTYMASKSADVTAKNGRIQSNKKGQLTKFVHSRNR